MGAYVGGQHVAGDREGDGHRQREKALHELAARAPCWFRFLQEILSSFRGFA